MSADAEPCKDETTITSVMKTVESCVKNVSPYKSDHTWWAKRVADQMRWTPRCTLDMVPSFLSMVLESYNYYGRDRNQAVDCVKTNLPYPDGKPNEVRVDTNRTNRE